MRGDRFAISPALSMQGAGSPLPSCENPGTASEIVVVPAREREIGPAIYPGNKERGTIVPLRAIYTALPGTAMVLLSVFFLPPGNMSSLTPEFENAGYHHAPFQVTFVAHAKLFRLPPFRDEVSSSWISSYTNCGHSISLGWKW